MHNVEGPVDEPAAQSGHASDTQRAHALASVGDGIFDVLVVGGGVVGAGIARDATLRGLRVVLVEKRDFAFGTSSRSSRLLHGGLRYLAQGRVGLVREASLEKTLLRRIAPHLVEPMSFIFPAYRGTDWPLWQLRIGVKVYDLLCGGKNFGPSTTLSRAETLERLPELASDRLAGAVRYFDGFTCDARLVMDTLRSAAAAGAALLNYGEFVEAKRDGSCWSCEVADRLARGSCRVKARAVVNATGPWGDRFPQSSVRLRLTKGIHCVLDRRRLPVPEAVVITEGRRILFIIPWSERVIVGTTDTDYDGPPEAVCTDPSDVAYVLQSVNRFFPGLDVAESDVLATWAGLRPLIAGGRGTPSDLSRSHQIRRSQPGWWDVAGGKLTTYRRMAEQAVDGILRELGQSVVPCRTADLPLCSPGPAVEFSGIVPPEPSEAAVRHFCHEEWAVHLEDVMLRRAGWGYWFADQATMARQVAGWMARVLGWSERVEQAELEQYRMAASWPPQWVSRQEAAR